MRRYLLFAILLVFISASVTYFILTIIGYDFTEEKNSELFDNKYRQNINITTENINNLEFNRLTEKVYNKLILERFYTFCGHKIIEEIRSDSPLLSLPKQELLKLYPGWNVKENNYGSLVLEIKINDLCPNDLKKRYVGEKEGYVTIFYGEPGFKEKILKVTDISTKYLPHEVIDQLKKGITIESEDHLISLIDGLAAYYFE